MSTQDKERWFVAVKVFLRDGDKLLILKDIFDDGWDLPGGRIRKDEFETPLLSVVERKMTEELGSSVQYQIDQNPKVYFRHERIEVGMNEQVRIFALGYEAQYSGGAVTLPEYMNRFEWVDITSFKPEDYFRGGWLKGVQEYLELQ